MVKNINLNLTSKSVKVGTRKINVSWSSQQLDDLQNMNKVWEYKYENVSEIDIIKNYFQFDSIARECVYYLMDKQTLRQIKLLILKEHELSDIFKKIIQNSNFVNRSWIQDIEDTLVKELTDSINKQILNKLFPKLNI